MLNVFYFAIFHIIIHGILKFNALTFILFWNERLINVSIVTFFTGMRWKFDVNTTAEVACIYLDFPKKELGYLIAVLNGAFGKKACFHFSHFLAEDIE